jgi:uncharacterized LabA/DUF88 family protein
MTQDKVMLLIDADNVSLDVIEQAVAWVGKHFGGPHVRRAYCTAESAVKHQTAFKRLAIRPMVNLAAGKNSTDIALAVDAIDLTLAERPEVVVIASSDSDFAPLVSRLREKGCRVIGIGQQGKTGDETRAVYDDYEVMEHRKAKAQGRSDARGESRGNGRANGRGEGRGEGRAEARSADRGTGRDRGRGQRKAVEPLPIPVEVPHIALATEVEAAHEGPLAQPAAEAPPLPSPAPAETRPARSRSRGGRRKPQAEALVAAPVSPEVAREAVLALVPEPAASPSPAERVEEAKPARKPRRRRSSPAKRAEGGGAGPLP